MKSIKLFIAILCGTSLIGCSNNVAPDSSWKNNVYSSDGYWSKELTDVMDLYIGAQMPFIQLDRDYSYYRFIENKVNVFDYGKSVTEVVETSYPKILNEAGYSLFTSMDGKSSTTFSKLIGDTTYHVEFDYVESEEGNSNEIYFYKTKPCPEGQHTFVTCGIDYLNKVDESFINDDDRERLFTYGLHNDNCIVYKQACEICNKKTFYLHVTSELIDDTVASNGIYRYTVEKGYVSKKLDNTIVGKLVNDKLSVLICYDKENDYYYHYEYLKEDNKLSPINYHYLIDVIDEPIVTAFNNQKVTINLTNMVDQDDNIHAGFAEILEFNQGFGSEDPTPIAWLFNTEQISEKNLESSLVWHFQS